MKSGMWTRIAGLCTAGFLSVVFTVPCCANQTWIPIYSTDFSSDPNWTTDDPGRLAWDSASQTYHGRQMNWDGTYAYTNIAAFDPNKAWRLDFDSIINSDDWSAGLTLGLFDSRLLYPYGAIVDRGRGDVGYAISLSTASSLTFKSSPSWSTGVWYHNELQYNPGSSQLTANITNRSTGSSLMNLSVPVSSFPSHMTNLGVSRLHIKGASSGLSPLATVDYNLDNITLSMVEVKPTGRIAFQSNADDPNYEIYTIRPDGSGRLRITSDGGVASYEPAWSHDGTRLAWYGGTPGSADIFVANHDGTGLSILNGGGDDVSPDFSPDGSQMVFTMVGGEALHTMAYPGGSVTPLAEIGSCPDWSADGRYITYTHWASGTAAEIWSLDLSLHTITRLTKRSLDGPCSWSEWSPDGSKIAYICAKDGTPDIWVMNPDGSGKTNLTASWTASDETDPTWSGDGSYLAFVSDLYGSKDIWVMNADGSNSYRVTTSPADEFAPDWGLEVPEPATLTLLGVGVVALTAALRRKTIVKPGPGSPERLGAHGEDHRGRRSAGTERDWVRSQEMKPLLKSGLGLPGVAFLFAVLALLGFSTRAAFGADIQDNLEDGSINSALWVTHGYENGAWSHSLSEEQAIDGFLEARVWGPESASTFGAEAYVRTQKNFNDGNDWIINFTWDAVVGVAPWVDGFAIHVTDGAYSEAYNWYWIAPNVAPSPTGTVGLWQSSGYIVNPPFGDQPRPPFSKETWSVAIDPTSSAILYQQPEGQGPAYRTVALDPSREWRLQFLLNDATSSGWPAGDNAFRLYDFSATIIPEPTTMLLVGSGVICFLGLIRRRT